MNLKSERFKVSNYCQKVLNNSQFVTYLNAND